MKLKMFLACLIMPMFFASANAQGPPNIYFARPLVPAPGSGGMLIEAAVASWAASSEVDLQNSSSFDGGPSQVFATTTETAATPGSRAFTRARMDGWILPPPGSSVAVTDQQLAAIHLGETMVQTGAMREAIADNYTYGFLDIDYVTQPGDAVEQTPENTQATITKLMYFIVTGPSEVMVETGDFFQGDLEDVVGNFFDRENFRQEIVCGSSNLELVHQGEGVYTIDGFLSNDTESAPNGPGTNFFAVWYGGVNNLFTSTQEVSISGEVIDVQITQESRTLFARETYLIGSPGLGGGLGGGPGVPGGDLHWAGNPGQSTWIATFSTSASFFGKDLLPTR